MFARYIWPLVLIAVLVAPGAAHGAQVNRVRHAAATSTTLTYAFEGLITRGPGGGIVGTGPITLTVAPTNSFTGTAVLTYNTTPPGPLHGRVRGVRRHRGVDTSIDISQRRVYSTAIPMNRMY